MSTPRARNLLMIFWPHVDTKNCQIIVETGAFAGNTKYKMRGELSPECAADLIRRLRRALRKIRDDETARLNKAVQDAEGDL